MAPYLADADFTLYQGDALTVPCGCGCGELVLDPDNLIVLCGDCHRAEHRKEVAA